METAMPDTLVQDLGAGALPYLRLLNTAERTIKEGTGIRL